MTTTKTGGSHEPGITELHDRLLLRHGELRALTQALVKRAAAYKPLAEEITALREWLEANKP